MNLTALKLTEELEEQIKRYASLKNINKSEAMRQLLIAGIDVTANESEILKEIKSLKSQIKDEHEFNKKGFDRLAKLSVKNGYRIYSTWQAILIQTFFRSKDKGLDDNVAKNSKEEVEKTALNIGIKEYNNRD